MTNAQKWFVLICLAFGAAVGGVIAQEQQSGGAGSSVAITNWPATQPVSLASAPTTPVTGTFWQTTQPVSGTFWQATQPVSGTVSVNALPAGANVIGKTVPATSCGTTVLSQAFIAVPTSNTAVTGTTTCVNALVFSNTNASPQTVTVTDGQGTPVTVISGFSIPANSQVTFPFSGAAMTSGVKWSAGGTGVVGAVTGVQ